MFFISLMIENILVMIDSYDKGNSKFSTSLYLS